MASSPRMVINDVDVPYDGAVSHVLRGTVVDVPAGSPMETAYGGPSNLQSLSAQQQASIAAGGSVVT